MADRLDDPLTLLGQEANEAVDFDGAFAQVLAKAEAHEETPATEAPAAKAAASQKPRRQKAWRAALSMAAAAVVLLGVAALMRQTGLLNGAGSAPPAAMPSEARAAGDAAAPQAAAAAETEPEAAIAPFAAAPASEPAGEPGAGAPRLASAQLEGSPFYAQGALLPPAPQEDGAADAGSAQAPLEVLGDICMLGEAPAKEALEALQSAGYTASLGGDAYVDQGRALESGEACIAPGGQIGVWNTGDGFITLTGPSLTQTEMYDAFLSAL